MVYWKQDYTGVEKEKNIMAKYVMALDAGTTSNRCILFDKKGTMCSVAQREFKQYFPKPGWVEHDADEIWASMLGVAVEAMSGIGATAQDIAAIGITNQRETVVVWDKYTGQPIYNAVVWQCMRGASICQALKDKGYSELVREKTGLLIDPYFSASGVKWILDNVDGARQKAENGSLLMGTIDSWLIWKLTEGKVHATDYTNASRTLLFNIHTLQWDDELLKLFTIPASMMPRLLPCDSVFGETTLEGLFQEPIQIAGVLGDSHGALMGQMCFEAGFGKATYGTGSSVMMNIGENAFAAPEGLVTSVGFAALGKVFYAFEGNIHCTGATIKWLVEQIHLIDTPAQIEEYASSVSNTEGVYFVPAFAGLGAPWWRSDVKAAIFGMTLGTTKSHLLRAALESIAYQVKDLADMMSQSAGIPLKELRVDGGPTKNNLLMNFQADMLQTPICCSDVEEASALGAVLMNGLARRKWNTFAEILSLRKEQKLRLPQMTQTDVDALYKGWQHAVKTLITSK